MGERGRVAAASGYQWAGPDVPPGSRHGRGHQSLDWLLCGGRRVQSSHNKYHDDHHVSH